MLLSPGLMLLTNYIAYCWPDVKPIKFCCIGSDVVKPNYYVTDVIVTWSDVIDQL